VVVLACNFLSDTYAHISACEDISKGFLFQTMRIVFCSILGLQGFADVFSFG